MVTQFMCPRSVKSTNIPSTCTNLILLMRKRIFKKIFIVISEKNQFLSFLFTIILKMTKQLA